MGPTPRYNRGVNRHGFGLALAALILLSVGFDWVGETERLADELETAGVTRRREIVRLLVTREGARAEAALVALLEDPNDDVRREAMDACARRALASAWPVFSALMVEGNAEIRASAARGLGRANDVAYVPILVRALGDAEAVVRAAALHALGSYADPSARGPVEARLGDDDARVRSAAAEALGRIGSPLATSSLLARIADDAPEVRLAVVEALGLLRDPSAAPALELALDDAHDPVRTAAALAIARIDHPRTVAILRAHLDGATHVARTCAAALAHIGTDDAIGALVDASLDASTRVPAKNALIAAAGRDAERSRRISSALALRLASVHGRAEGDDALGTLGILLAAHANPAITATLADLLARELTPSPALMAALGHSGGDEALVPLLAIATRDDPSPTAADRAMHALRALTSLLERGGPDGRIADPLLEALSSTTDVPRVVAIIEALGRSGAERAVPSLTRLSEHATPSVRIAALSALGRIGSALASPRLLAALGAASADERRAARSALGLTMDAASLGRAITRATEREATDRVAILEAVAEAMPRLGRGLSPDVRAQLAQRVAPLVESPRGELSALAIEIAARTGAPETNALLVTISSRRGPEGREALAALGLVEDDASLARLREAVTDDDAAVRAVAVIALGERGGADDLARIVAVAERGPWAPTLAASFAVARLARRAVLTASDADAICSIGLARDPVVRANLIVARASIGAPACLARASTGEPSEPFLRAAEARAAHARGDGLDVACRAPIEEIVRDACARETWPALDGRAVVTAFDADGHTLLPGRFLAIAFADGTIVAVESSRAARIVLDHVPTGPMMLLDPSRTSLER